MRVASVRAREPAVRGDVRRRRVLAFGVPLGVLGHFPRQPQGQCLADRAGLVVALSIPLVLVIVFIGMELMDIALQRISLGALIM